MDDRRASARAAHRGSACSRRARARGDRQARSARCRRGGSGGWIDAPAGGAFLEESVTAPSARGRGVAPAAWCGVADELAASGTRSLHTPVEPGNRAVRRALAKAGFVPVGATHTTRLGPRVSVRVEVLDDAGSWLRVHAR